MDRKYKLLIVDDDNNILQYLNQILKEKYEVMVCSSPLSVIDIVDSFKPEVIILDVMMPDINGIELCRKIRENKENDRIFIILLTAMTDDKFLYEGLNSGANDYIKKPFSELELTARINNVIKLSETYKNLEMVSNLKDRFLSMVTHDLKTPLTAIIGYCELLLENRVDGQLTEKQRSILLKILDSANHQKKIIKDFFSYSLAGFESIQLNMNSHKLNDIIQSVLEELTFLLKEKNINVLNKIEEKVVVKCDFDRISQVFSNLLTNAIKFSFKDSIIELYCNENKEFVTVYVKDYGMGISKENIEKVMDEYDIFTTKGSNGEKGTGLGISICKKILRAHNSQLKLETEEGKGTTFYFDLKKG